MLIYCGADLTQRNVIHALCEFCSVDVVRYAVKKGANIDEVDGTGANVIHSAARNEDSDVLRFLLEDKGMGHLVNATNRTGKTPLLKALKRENEKTVVLLLQHGADPNVPHPTAGDWPIHIAVALEMFRAVEALIKAGADMNAAVPAPYGFTALHYGAEVSGDMVLTLLQAGANPNVRDHLDNTPLHIAAQPNNWLPSTDEDQALLIVQALLEGGADGTLKNLMGVTAIEVAKAWHFFGRAYLIEMNDPHAMDGPAPSGAWELYLRHRYASN
jgi:ankyrin repeat protein